jgi:arginyl-tRNA synthetase
MMSIAEIKTAILTAVEMACQKAFGQKPDGLKLEYPPKVEFGDFAVGCFPLAKQFRQNPAQIAQTLAAEILQGQLIEKIQAIGPYLNLKICPNTLFGGIGMEITEQSGCFGNSSSGNGQRVMVEYVGPNSNKPLHLGHVRNAVLGTAVSNLLEATAHTVVRANIVNDRGIHICKSMLAWQNWADGATPASTGTKGDHFVADWYVRYDREEKKNPALAQEPPEMLRRWEADDPEIVKLWKMMNEWVYAGLEQTYQTLDLAFDVFYYESDTYKLGKDLIDTGLGKGVFFKAENGAVITDLPVNEFGTNKDGSTKIVTLLRPDGTSLYITQDLGTAKMKFDHYQLDRSIYVVGAEQDDHFHRLFTLLDMLGFEWVSECYHLSYGHVNLPEGRMKSREGTVVDADDLIEEMRQLAADEIRVRNPEGRLSEDEIQKRGMTIGLAAIKFYLLKARPELTIEFDPKASISFDGFTGPYCQYAYARCAGIQRNAQNRELSSVEPDFSLLGNPEELQLIRTLIQFPEVVESAARELSPARICNHLFTIAQTLNQFYHHHPVVSADHPALAKARLALVSSTSVVLKKGLTLLGIETLEEM